jgi:hypothetical protein
MIHILNFGHFRLCTRSIQLHVIIIFITHPRHQPNAVTSKFIPNKPYNTQLPLSYITIFMFIPNSPTPSHSHSHCPTYHPLNSRSFIQMCRRKHTWWKQRRAHGSMGASVGVSADLVESAFNVCSIKALVAHPPSPQWSSLPVAPKFEMTRWRS